MNYIFFGTPDRAVIVLKELEKVNLKPLAIVTSPDKPVGRKQISSQSAVSSYAEKLGIKTYKPANKLELSNLETELRSLAPDFIIVVAYGYLIPDNILNIAKYESLNVHYSLLPKFRGASPVISQILNNETIIGFSIMKLISKLDAGPVYYTESFAMPTPLPTTETLANIMSIRSAMALPIIAQKIISENLKPISQDDSLATYCGKITKNDGEVNIIKDTPQEIFQKIQAYSPWPKTFFIISKDDKEYRVIINDATMEQKLEIKSVTIAGKNPITWNEFCNWLGYDPLAKNLFFSE